MSLTLTDENQRKLNLLYPKKVPTLLGGPEENHKTMWEDCYKHISLPVMGVLDQALIKGEGNGLFETVYAPPGSGKTFTFVYDLSWRAVRAAAAAGMRNMVILYVSPDTSVNDQVYQEFRSIMYNDQLTDKIHREFGVYLSNVLQTPDQITGRDLEILVCTTQMAAEHRDFYLKGGLPKRTEIILKTCDEAHKGLGCPETSVSFDNLGHHYGESYNAVWFNSLREIKSYVWLGFSGTPTPSMKNEIQKDKYYHFLSSGMEKATWRLGFPDTLDMGNYGGEEIVEKVAMKNAISNAINVHLFSLLDETKIPSNLYEIFKNHKGTAMLRCGIETSAYLVPSTAQYLWNKLIQTMEGLEWDYVEPWSRKKVSLKLTLDKCAILTSEEKTYDSNGAAIRLLNEKESGYGSVAVCYIGGVGVNITNLVDIGIIPSLQNDNDIDMGIIQLLGRLDRCMFVWQGYFSSAIAQIEDPIQKEIAIRLAINMTTKRCTARTSELTEQAWDKFVDGHILKKEAYGYLSGKVEDANRILSEVKQDDYYKQFKKEHCEVCPLDEGGIPVCEVTARENHSNMSDEEFKEYWFGCLDVDHEDSDHTNNDPKNLPTKCKNEHQFKTMENKDYLNRYKDGILYAK